MSALEQTLRRNFIVAAVMHLALLGGILFFEGYLSRVDRNPLAFVELITPPDILGDLPKGPGQGRGASAPPAEPPQASVGPLDSALAADERPAPAPQPKAVTKTADVAGEIKIPQKTATITQKKTANVKPATKVKTTTVATTAPATTSADEFRKRFAKALIAAGDGSKGTPYGDNKAPGGGTGESKYGRPGSPDGAIDGVPGGVGKGSPFWSYYLHVHDKMYEAWEQPGKALNWDKNLLTTVMIRVARDGRILETRLTSSSGNDLMDDSVTTAVRRIERLNPLPEGLGTVSYAEIRVNFQLGG
jgi:TonB family protein